MPATDAAREGIWSYGLSFIGSPSSELFLALSGTVLLPVKAGFRSFYKRRFMKLLPPLVIWSILGVLLFVLTNRMTWHKALNSIMRIPMQPAIIIYWFVYAMAGLYLLAPFISPWLRQASKRQLQFFLTLWIINMTMPWIKFFWPDFTSLFITDGNYYWTLCYFGGFLGYWLMGYYLNKYPIRIGMNVPWITLIILSILYPVSLAVLKLREVVTSPLTDNLQLGSAIYVALYYTVAQNVKLRKRIQTAITHIAKYSFGIYLTHIYIAHDLYWGLFEGSKIHLFPRTFLIALLTLLTGYTLTWLLSRIPKGKYIVGV